MIARIRPTRRLKPEPWHQAFLAMLPKIITHAKVSFRHLNREAREEAVQEVVCNACRAYARLVELGKASIAYPLVLAGYGVRQVKDGRKVGGKLNVRDVMSRYCQQRKGVTVERIDHWDEAEGCWLEAVVQDTRNAPVAETVAFRCDFADWLDGLRRRDRRVAEFLAAGNRTSDAAKRFHVSAGRISQMRRELCDSWRGFQHEEPATTPA